MNTMPKVGEECLWLSYRAEVWVHTKVIHYHEEFAWLEGEGVVFADDPNKFKEV